MSVTLPYHLQAVPVLECPTDYWEAEALAQKIARDTAPHNLVESHPDADLGYFVLSRLTGAIEEPFLVLTFKRIDNATRSCDLFLKLFWHEFPSYVCSQQGDYHDTRHYRDPSYGCWVENTYPDGSCQYDRMKGHAHARPVPPAADVPTIVAPDAHLDACRFIGPIDGKYTVTDEPT